MVVWWSWRAWRGRANVGRCEGGLTVETTAWEGWKNGEKKRE